MADHISFSAVGDCFITRCAPNGDPALAELAEIIRENDVRLANLEVSLNDGNVYPSAICGGTWSEAHPDVLVTMQAYGFNALGWANNHTLDYLHDGVINTKYHLEQIGFVHAGGGENLYEASTPKYIETANGRVALISCATTAPADWIAGEQRKDSIGRPGLNLLRTTTVYTVTSDNIQRLQRLAEELGINTGFELLIENGFHPPIDKGITIFGNHQFKEGNGQKAETYINPVDLERLIGSVEQATQRADHVLVSLHTHEMNGINLEEPAEFIVDFAHECIDHGADAIVGHGPHIIRGIEIYQHKPIFYSLGNFIYQADTALRQPADMYEKFGMDNRHNVVDLFTHLNENATRSHAEIPEMWQSVLPVWKMDGSRLVEICLHPLDLGYGFPNYRMGWPSLTNDIQVLERIKFLSEKFGTKISIENGVGKIVFD